MSQQKCFSVSMKERSVEHLNHTDTLLMSAALSCSKIRWCGQIFFDPPLQLRVSFKSNYLDTLEGQTLVMLASYQLG